MSLVQVDNLAKSYGTIQAINNFDLAASKGELVAVAGPDGAGKTTLFRTMCGLLEYDSGIITIAGLDIHTQFDKIKSLLGYMPQNFSLYPDLSVEENLSFYAGLFGLNGREYEKKKERLYRFSGLGPFAGRRAGNLSGGMKQKLALSCNLIHDPEILILDEPTTGVDPLSRRQFWDILKTLRQEGSTIIVSTPYMDEVSLADRAIFIHNGKKLIEGPPDELTKIFSGSIYAVRLSPTARLIDQLNLIDGLISRRFGASIHTYVSSERGIDEFSDKLGAIGVGRDVLVPINPELEDLFIQLMEQSDA